MIYRVVNEKRMPQVKELWAYSFEKPDEPFYQWYFDNYCGRDNMVVGGFDEQDKLQNMLHLNPYMLRVRGVEMLTPYIVGVATAPEARGSHLFGGLIETAFEIIRSESFPFTLLMPIYAGIYLPYQFAYCYYRHGYDMPLASLKVRSDGDDLTIRRMELDKEVLGNIYFNATQTMNGAPVRTDFQWNKLLAVHKLEGVHCAVCYSGDAAAGYMLYKLENGTFNVVELLAANQKVRNRLLAYAAQHKSEAKRFTWLAEEWDKTYLQFADQSLTGSVQPFMMARCVDARLALEKLPVPDNCPIGSVVLLLNDNVIGRNNHLLKLETAQGSLKMATTMDDEEVTMDMGAFTQLYFGMFSAAELAEAGRIKVNDYSKLAVLDALMPKCRNYINEYF